MPLKRLLPCPSSLVQYPMAETVFRLRPGPCSRDSPLPESIAISQDAGRGVSPSRRRPNESRHGVRSGCAVGDTDAASQWSVLLPNGSAASAPWTPGHARERFMCNEVHLSPHIFLEDGFPRRYPFRERRMPGMLICKPESRTSQQDWIAVNRLRGIHRDFKVCKENPRRTEINGLRESVLAAGIQRSHNASGRAPCRRRGTPRFSKPGKTCDSA